MIKKLLLPLLPLVSLFHVLQVTAQSPLAKSWDHRYGGDKTHFISAVIQTRDGGYLLDGTSYSGISGDKSDSVLGWSG